MKKLFTLFLLLFVFGAAIAQEKADAVKEQSPMKPALLVIDTQNAFLKYMSEEKGTTLEMINWAIWLARKNNIPVIRVYHTDPEWGPKPGTEEFEYEKSLQVKEDDPKVIKNFPSSFKKTKLDEILKEKVCNTLYLCGLSATGCVLATYFGALDLDYHPFMLKGAIMSDNHESTDAVEGFCETVTIDTFGFMLEHH